MIGLETLMQEGLDMAALNAGSTAELLEWHCVAGGSMPDAEVTVLLWLRYADGSTDWCSGFFDGEAWCDCTAMPVSCEVTHWAQPEGPA